MFKLTLLAGSLIASAVALAPEPTHTKDPQEKQDLLNGQFSSLLKSCDKKGQEFLLEKAKQDDVWMDLKTGLMFKILTKGKGEEHPLVNTQCKCHYSGTLVDGKEFDSSYKRGQPLEFAPNQVIKGWTIAMQQMVQGDKWELYIPADLAYGSRGAGGAIPGEQALKFVMELVKINHTGKGKTVPVEKEVAKKMLSHRREEL